MYMHMYTLAADAIYKNIVTIMSEKEMIYKGVHTRKFLPALFNLTYHCNNNQNTEKVQE